MIFRTMAEQDRVMGMIDRREMFDDLKPEQKYAIQGAYNVMDMVGSWLEDLRPIDSDPMYEKSLFSYLEESAEHLEILMASEVAEMYVSFCDDNYSEESETEQEPKE